MIASPDKESVSRDTDITLDINLGLKRLGGDKNLYYEIIQDFTKLYADFPHRFMLAMEAGGDAPLLIAHTLKGAAGNISAVSLQNAAAKLERACRNNKGRDTVLALLKQVDTALQNVLEFSLASL